LCDKPGHTLGFEVIGEDGKERLLFICGDGSAAGSERDGDAGIDE
jgi:hypothetical protein